MASLGRFPGPAAAILRLTMTLSAVGCELSGRMATNMDSHMA